MLSACIGGAYDECFDNDYCLSALDVDEDMSLMVKVDGYMIGIVGPTVYAIGYDERHIIVKQVLSFNRTLSDKNDFQYFIVPLVDKVSDVAEKNLIGPLDLRAFEQYKLKLGVAKDLLFRDLFND